jgi:ATP-dependent DNA helicase RecQ
MVEIIDLHARERFRGYSVKFFQSIAVPKEFLDSNYIRNFCNYKFINQWRIDYPKEIGTEVPKEFKTILSIAHKILTRGEYTTLSSYLEDKFSSRFVNKGQFNPSAYDLTISNHNSTFWFDGDMYEKNFFENILPKILGDSFKRFVLPQVEFHSLVYDYDQYSESKESKERVDFLITSNKSNVVVELDGAEHNSQRSKDYSRTRRLNENGFKEIRINNSDLQNPNCLGIQALKKEFETFNVTKYTKTEYDKYINSFKLAHQFQITLIELLFVGLINDTDINKINYDYDFLNEYTNNEIKFIIEESLTDLKQLIAKLSELYNLPYNINKLQIDTGNEANLILTYNENIETQKSLCIIQDISFPRIITKELKSSENLKIIQEPSNEQLEYFLKYIFGYSSFREGQVDSLKRILLNKDTIALLPTGAGKSLIFQLASLLLPGVSVIVVPIKSLMHDQVENLERKGITRAIGLSGDIESRSEKEKVQALIHRGQYLFIYVAPERFLIDEFRDTLQEFTKKYLISLIVIDESHCVSEWGHDFRPAYLTVGKNSRIYCKNKDGFIPPLLALTGTASENVLLDVKEDLEIKDEGAVISSETFDRKELHFNIIKCKTDEKYLCVKKIIEKELPEKLKTDSIFKLNGKSTKSGIIFCPFTTNKETNPRGVEYFIEKIKEDFGNICEPHYSNENNRLINAKNFQENNFPLLIATKGYGMGIDKPNIRYIIHVNLPPSVEAYYQEAGRAGRDRERSECFIIYSCSKDGKNDALLDLNTPLEKIKSICQQPGKWDDIRSLFHFHTNSFKGKKDEMDIIGGILDEINDLNQEYQPFKSKFDNINSTMNNDDDIFKAKQKAIFRLTAIGVITNYGIDYASNEFSLKINKITKENVINHYFDYVKKYNQFRAKIERGKLENKKDVDIKNFILYCCELFLDYVYDYYEKGRRQALYTMLSILEKSISCNEPDKLFREEISNFLKRTYSKQLLEIANSKDLTKMLLHIRALLGDSDQSDSLIKPVSDFKSLYSQISRTMEDYPESLGLFLLRAYVPVKIGLAEENQIIKDINQFLILSTERYRFDKETIYPLMSWLLLEIVKVKNHQGLSISKEMINKINDEKLTIMLIRDFEKEKISFDYGKVILLKNIYTELENNFYGGE